MFGRVLTTVLLVIAVRIQASTLRDGEGRTFRFPDPPPEGATTIPDTPVERSNNGVADLVRNTLRSSQIVDHLSETVDSGQILRLRGGKGPNIGYLEVFSNGDWFVLCDEQQTFSDQEATVACRQMGYDHGALHFTHGDGNLGDLASVLQRDVRVLNSEVGCRGEENDMTECAWSPRRSRCLPERYAVAVVCAKPSYALCEGSDEPFMDKCYSAHTDVKMSFKDAEAACAMKPGGKLVEINSQAESDFVSEWLRSQGHEGTNFWTGGLLNSVAGKLFPTWYASGSPMDFTNFLTHPNAVEEVTAKGVALTRAHDYHFWLTADLTANSAFVCESPMLDVGCISESGANYNGSAKRGESGKTCLPWDTEGLQEIFPGQGEWTHNECRNPRGLEEAPICFINAEEYDYCEVPKCDEIRRREIASRSS